MTQKGLMISWPGWENVRLIGRGSFGSVYEIQRDVFGDVEKAALKIISIPKNTSDIDEMYSDGYDDESITSTFQSHLKSIVAEYSLMRKMNGCVNIVNCDDIRYIQHDNGIGWDIFIKMDLLTPLTKALPAEVSEETVVKIAKDLCNALTVCKEHNVIHRDIKPQNIFVSQFGDYKLGDFGIAKTVEKTMGGTKIGTYKYMAPEVYNNQPYGVAADIYSLGLVLYWLLNERRLPFLPLPPAKLSAGMEDNARQRRLSGEPLPPPAHGSEKLKKIVLKACAYDPKDRYASAAEMLADLNGSSIDEAAYRRQKQEEQERIARAQAEKAEQERIAQEQSGDHNQQKNQTKKIGLIFLLCVVVVCSLIGIRQYYLRPHWKEVKGQSTYVVNGVRLTGWHTIDGSKYYFGDDGIMRTGLCQINNSKYYFGTDGIMKTGWHVVDKNKYYFDAHGTMQTGWQTIQGKKYCFARNGAMLVGKWRVGDSYFYFDQNGVMVTGQKEIEEGHVYQFDSDGCFLYKDVTLKKLDSTWGESLMYFPNIHGGNASGYAKILKNPLSNVSYLSLELTMESLEYGNADGQWIMRVRDLNGYWQYVGVFNVKDGKGNFTITFDEPIEFDAYICTSYYTSGWSGHYSQNITELVYRDYSYGAAEVSN